MRIRLAGRADWESVMDLAWKTFLEFEAPDYSEEGIQSFKDFITDEFLFRMFAEGYYQVLVAEKEGEIVGFISVRNRNHISLLFVRKENHHQKIGTRLIEKLGEYLVTELGEKRMTVDSAPYATDFYHHLGFYDIEKEKTVSGIRFVPMQLNLEGRYV